MATKILGMGALARSIDKTAARPGDAERAAIREMVKSAKERGLDITGPDGLLKLLTKTVLETALEEELTDHLGYDKNDPAGRDGGNSRNGTRTKTVISDAAGEVTIEVPRDRDGSFTPVIVKKRQRRLGDVDKIVLSLYGKGMTTGEISARTVSRFGRDGRCSPWTVRPPVAPVAWTVGRCTCSPLLTRSAASSWDSAR